MRAGQSGGAAEAVGLRQARSDAGSRGMQRSDGGHASTNEDTEDIRYGRKGKESCGTKLNLYLIQLLLGTNTEDVACERRGAVCVCGTGTGTRYRCRKSLPKI